METEPWFKLQLKTPDKRQVYAMANVLKKDVDLVLGKLIRWWCWLDLHTVDSHTGMTPDSVDSLLRLKNFSRALVDVGWASLADDGTLDVVHWGEHNGETAKKRALTARRVGKHRASKSNAASVTGTEENEESSNAKSVTNPLQVRYLEKENNNNNMMSSRATLNCEPPKTLNLAQQTSTLKSFPDGFREWLGAVGLAHPAVAESRVLHPAVEAAALAAFGRCPHASQHAGLLKAYLNDRLDKDRNGHTFYRPGGQERFFEQLENTIANAKRWDKETGWSRRCDKKGQISHRTPPSCPRNPLPAILAHPEEQARLLGEITSLVEDPPRTLNQKT